MNQTPIVSRKPIFIDSAINQIKQETDELLRKAAPELAEKVMGIVYDRTRDMLLPLVRLTQDAREIRILREYWGLLQFKYSKIRQQYHIIYEK